MKQITTLLKKNISLFVKKINKKEGSLLKSSRPIGIILITLLSLVGYGALVFASPNIPGGPLAGSGGFSAGTELDPDCAPNQVAPEPCVVKLPPGESTMVNNGLTLTGTNVKLGGTLVNNTVVDQGGFEFSTYQGVLATTGITKLSNEVNKTILFPAVLGGPTTGAFSGSSFQFNDGTLFFDHSSGSINTGSLNGVFMSAHGEDLIALSGSDATIMVTPKQITSVYENPTVISVLNQGGSFGLNTTDKISGDFDQIDLNSTSGFRISSNLGGYTFPRTDGTANQVLTTDGAGQLSWQNGGGGSSYWKYDDAGGGFDQPTYYNDFYGTPSPIVLVGTNNVSKSGIELEGTSSVDHGIDILGNSSNSGSNGIHIQGSGIFSDIELSASNGKLLLSGIGAGLGKVLMSDANGFATWQTPGGGGSGSSLKWYAENATAPGTTPIATGLGSIALGDGAEALSDNMLVYGQLAGQGATNAFFSNFFGINAGQNATNASGSNFIGRDAGIQATNAYGSNFFGKGSGRFADNAFESNFFGQSAGNSATNASESIFIGSGSGASAVNAYKSIFLGSKVGVGALNASNSFFVGENAGAFDVIGSLGTRNANNSIFIGNNAAYTVADSALNNSGGHTSILIGDNTSTGGFSDSIALGAGATNTVANQLMIGSNASPINTLILTGSGGNTCVLDVTVASPSCSSDETLKTNIADLSSTTLDQLMKVKTVTYNWKNYPTKGTQIGFLAQDLEQYFPQVVSLAPNGYKTVSYGGMTPVLTKAIQELNIKLSSIESVSDTLNPTFIQNIRNWLADAGNGITKLFVHEVETEKLCVKKSTGVSVCITGDELDNLLNQNQVVPVTPSSNNLNNGTNNGSESNTTDGVQNPSETPVEDVPTETIVDPQTTNNPSVQDAQPQNETTIENNL